MEPTREKFEQNDIITWIQVHNFLPIALVIVSITAFIYIMQGRIDLLKQEVDYRKYEIDRITQQMGILDSRINSMNVKGVSTISPTLKGGVNK